MRPPADLEVLTFRPWADELVAAHGHPIDGHYVETFWLPVLGPSTVWMARRLAAWGDGSIELSELGAALGLGAGAGRRAPVRRTLERLCSFDVARYTGVALEVRTHLGPISRRHLARLPGWLAAAHETVPAA